MRKNSLRSQSPKLSPEELAKTQVLNLSDVERVANYEKKTSKKPAIVLALIGVLSISMGFLYTPVQTMMAKAPEKEVKEEKKLTDDSSITEARVEDTTVPTTLTCMKTALANEDGTDRKLIYTLTFHDGKLQSYKKQYTATPSAGNTNGPVSIKNQLTNYKYLETVQLDGYKLYATETTTGYIVDVEIDLTNFNRNTFPSTHIYSFVTAVEYTLNADQTAVNNNLTAKGYVCQ